MSKPPEASTLTDLLAENVLPRRSSLLKTTLPGS